MSLDKAIRHGKEHRKPYRGGKAVSKRCRNHGGCYWCEGNRRHKYRKSAMKGACTDVLVLRRNESLWENSCA